MFAVPGLCQSWNKASLTVLLLPHFSLALSSQSEAIVVRIWPIRGGRYWRYAPECALPINIGYPLIYTWSSNNLPVTDVRSQTEIIFIIWRHLPGLGKWIMTSLTNGRADDWLCTNESQATKLPNVAWYPVFLYEKPQNRICIKDLLFLSLS